MTLLICDIQIQQELKKNHYERILLLMLHNDCTAMSFRDTSHSKPQTPHSQHAYHPIRETYDVVVEWLWRHCLSLGLIQYKCSGRWWGLKDGKDECGSSDDDDDEDGMQIVLLVLFLLQLLKLSLATAALFQQSALKKGHSLFTLENTHTHSDTGYSHQRISWLLSFIPAIHSYNLNLTHNIL